MGVLQRLVHFYALRPYKSAWPRRYTRAQWAGRVAPIAAISQDGLDLNAFRKQAFGPEQPLLVKSQDCGRYDESCTALPAARRWFVPQTAITGAGSATTLAPCLTPFAMTQLPYELMYFPTRQSGAEDGGSHTVLSKDDAAAGFVSWLAADTTDPVRPGLAALLAEHMSEVTAGEVEQKQQQKQKQKQMHPQAQLRLVRMHAPLALLMAGLAYNDHLRRHPEGKEGTAVPAGPPLTQLYVAQAALADLPPALQRDLAAPDLVQRAGRGDVYGASLWLGLEPTYTPWHRDPNPNLFGQLCGSKTVRLLPPGRGERIFRDVQAALQAAAAAAAAAATTTPVHARIRGEEMMHGPERAALHDAIWGDAPPAGADTKNYRNNNGDNDTAQASVANTIHEAHLEPGDLLFIPKGWWHSVKSTFSDGRLNASVNWWFR
ncbi:Cupin, JmjC-type [Niveomyces insectorum RCEF 264]|uniref:Cupin, JmjC-type n=1 Tax=Niveomyces insectorum RCEF 264 TaxID=1081102 RepID=A0A168AFW5_9HYPO|nr:Cupin, JmjC-type [Niveomyces insectorum RCEF 264]